MSTQSAASGYAGELSVQEAWSLLETEPTAQLIDVRTAPEWVFVGLPDLSPLGREVKRIEWQVFPSMAANPDFLATVTQAVTRSGGDRDTAILFVCRSGVRSRSAAIALTEAGFTRAYNVAGGFEGDLDGESHRGGKNGWKASGLPWRQT
jgi:rhodanese-related sulfurtransferase